MLVLSSVGGGLLLAPLVILTSRSANFFVMSIKANSWELDWGTGACLVMILGGTNKSALGCLNWVASTIGLAPGYVND